MEYQRARKKIERLKADLDSMRRSRDWYQHRYVVFITYVREKGLPLPWADDDLSGPDEEESPGEVPRPTPTKLEQAKHHVLGDLNSNCDRAPSGHRYSQATKIFAFAADVFSGACYRLMRELLDLPSERTLQDFSGLAVARIERYLTNVETLRLIISQFMADSRSSLPGTVFCTLCIDAFSINPTARADQKSSSPDRCNNSFLFQLTPLNRCLRVCPVHLHPATTGAAGPAIRTLTDNVIRQVKSAHPRLVLMFASVDGDEGYAAYFQIAFASILGFLNRAQFDDQFCNFIRAQQPFWVSDWLHLMKNARTKLFGRKVFMNPQSLDSCATMDGIAASFETSPTFTDDSPLGKMRDSYPLDLFTLQRAFVLYQQQDNLSNFLYLFVFGLWSEALENRHFHPMTRVLILETLMTFFYAQYSLLQPGMHHPAILQKRSGESDFVTFAPENKLKRYICTLSGQIVGLHLDDPDLGIDRIGSHTEENFIGNVRTICHGDHRWCTVLHQLARFEVARSLLTTLGIERKIAKRVNLGGISLGRTDVVDVVLEGTSSDFAAELLAFAGISGWTIGGKGSDAFTPCNFIEQIWALMECAPLETQVGALDPSIQNNTILTRYRAFQSGPQEGPASEELPPPVPESASRPSAWSREERQRIMHLIYHRVQDFEEICGYFPGRTARAVQRQLDRVYKEMCYRPWLEPENAMIITAFQQGLKHLLPTALTARNERAIQDQIRHLHAEGRLPALF